MVSPYPYLKIIRPFNCFLVGFSLYIGILITMGHDILFSNLYLFTIGTIIVTLVSAGGFVVNDIYDLEIDKINQPLRILPSQQISLTAAKVYTIILFTLGFILSLYALTIPTTINLGYLPPFFVIIGIIFLILYASYLKKLGVVGNLVITGLSAITFIIGGLFINDVTRAFFPLLLVISLQYSREIIKDVEDIKGDVEASDFMFSLPTVIGVRNTIAIGKLLLLSAIICTFLPFTISNFEYFRSWAVIGFAIILDLILVYSIIILRGTDDNLIMQAKKVKKILKVGIAVGLVGLALNPYTLI